MEALGANQAFDLVEFLEAIRRRPGAFLGDREDPFGCLVGFVVGFRAGCFAGRGTHGALPDLIPVEFLDFVAAELDGRRASSMNWIQILRDSCRTSAEAVDRFLELRIRFEAATRKAGRVSPPSS